MDNGAKKKLRDVTGRLRQVLEKHFRDKGLSPDDVAAKAWRWAFRLGVEQALAIRGIADGRPSFLADITSPSELEPPSLVLQSCRELLGGSKTEIQPLAAADALGWLHQYWFDLERQAIAANAGGDSYAKITVTEIIPATQVYTERYIVDFLLQNSLGAFWLGMYPQTRLASGWSYYVPKAPVAGLPVKPPAAISLLDPACGTGNFLLAAFDLLYDMYQEEGETKDPAAICASILKNNLFGVDIDERAIQITRAALWLKAKERAPSLQESELTGWERHIIAAGRDTMFPDAWELGSLFLAGEESDYPAANLLKCRYDVVVTNPPYVDKRDYSSVAGAYLRQRYPAGAGNIYTAFILRSLSLAERYVGMITPQTFLFLTSYAALRQSVFQSASIRTLAHLGLGTFADAVVDTAMFVLAKKFPGAALEQTGVYFKLLEAPQKDTALRSLIASSREQEWPDDVFCRSTEQFALLEGSPVAYWLGDALRAMIQQSKPLRHYADIVLGMKTSDNKRFVRYWWEVDDQERKTDWTPYEKEASGYRFQRNSAHCVRWTETAQNYFKTHYSAQLPNPKYWFRPGLVYGLVSSKAFTAKLLPGGHMTDMAASCVFPHDESDRLFLLGILNSKLYQWLLKLFNPTVNYQPGDLQRLPVPELAPEVKQAIGGFAASAALAIGRLREREITDRNYCFAPEELLPLAEKLPQVVASIWLNSLQYTLARDAIDLRLAAALDLPPQEYRAVLCDMGGLPVEYPLIAGYDILPPEVSRDLFMLPPEKRLRVTPESLAEYKNRLKLLYSDGPAREGSFFAADYFEEMVMRLKLHPVTVYQLITEGISSEGWHCRRLERRLVEDFFSAVVLKQLGHRWQTDTLAMEASGEGLIVPVYRDVKGKTMPALVRELVGGYADMAETEAQFADIVGVSFDGWLADSFFKRHVSQFKKRPVIWQLASRPQCGSPAFAFLLHRRQAKMICHVKTQFMLPQLQQLQTGGWMGESSCQVREIQDFIARLESLRDYNPDPDFGVRVNIAPLQQAGILKTDVLSADDLERAAAAHREWQDNFY
ncbi:MAG: Eco57I restriction-modification methylase domain-containing protein [Negativicutes bacterium]|nr:Eco57I restriction-modification methylase domain-containing protein [Negativicutes bacterium]